MANSKVGTRLSSKAMDSLRSRVMEDPRLRLLRVGIRGSRVEGIQGSKAGMGPRLRRRGIRLRVMKGD